MSTFSQGNGPGCDCCCDDLIYKKLQVEIEALKGSIAGLLVQLGNYPGTAAADIRSGAQTPVDYTLYAKEIIVKTLRVLTTFAVDAITVAGQLKGGTVVSDGALKGASLDVGSGAVKGGNANFSGNIAATGNVKGTNFTATDTAAISVLGQLQAAATTLASLVVQNGITVQGGGLGVTGQTTLQNLNAQATTLNSLTVTAATTLATLLVNNAATLNSTLTVAGTTTLGALVTNAAATLASAVINDTLRVVGNTTLAHLVAATAEITSSLKTDNILSRTGQMLLQRTSANKLVLGDAGLPLEIQSTLRPKITDNGAAHELAYLSDLVSSIIFEGTSDYRVQAAGYLPAPGTKLPTSETTSKTVANGDTAVVVSDAETIVATLYTLQNNTWTQTGSVNVGSDTGDHAYQWHLNYTPSNGIYHEAEMIWAPHSQEANKVSIINLPLENYYTRSEVDALLAPINNLSHVQSDWLENEDELPDGTTNPAFIQNRPITGISVLDGGDWSDPLPPDYPWWIVDGGDFNKLGTCLAVVDTRAALPVVPGTHGPDDYAIVRADETHSGVRARYKISGTAWVYDYPIGDWVEQGTRQNAIIRVWRGLKANMPAATADTSATLKYCTDTRELYLDTGNASATGTVQGNVLINVSLTSAGIAALFSSVGDPARETLMGYLSRGGQSNIDSAMSEFYMDSWSRIDWMLNIIQSYNDAPRAIVSSIANDATALASLKTALGI
jgi:hypothetical protein